MVISRKCQVEDTSKFRACIGSEMVDAVHSLNMLSDPHTGGVKGSIDAVDTPNTGRYPVAVSVLA
jgi:hypothetical protein